MAKMPYLYDFCLRTFYSEKEEISEPLKEKLSKDISEIYSVYFRNIDRSKFIDGVEPLQVLNMLIWMTDGYLHMQRYSGNSQDLDAMMEEFSRCAQLLKKAIYKEAYQ